MLCHLARYAQQAGLAPEPGFATRKVHWAVHVDRNGRYQRIENLARAGRPRQFPRCPELSQPELLGGGESCPRSHFLVESARVLLDHLGAQLATPTARVAPEDPAIDPTRLAGKRLHFQTMLQQLISAQPQLAWLAATDRFLNSPDQRHSARQTLIAARGAPGDRVVIVVDGRNPLEDTAWHDWWREYRATLAPKSQPRASLARDLMTGQPILPLSTHRRIKGLQSVGGHPSGDALISFGQPAFESYGFDRAHNAPLSAQSEADYVLALNHLLGRARRVGALMLCAWTDPLAGDPLSPLFGETEIGKGEEGARFHVLMLSANHGRVVLRDHIQGNQAQLSQALANWREDLFMTSVQGTPSLDEILSSLRPRPGELPVTLASDIVRAAVSGTPLPGTLLPLILDRIKSDITNPKRQPFHPARMALLKARLLRSQVDAPRQLSGNHRCPAYHCGRLLAILAKQLGHPGITSVQRSYHAASHAPAAVIPRLLEQARMRKAAPPPMLARLTLPLSLDLRQQALFALGYHHQKSHDHRPRVPREYDYDEGAPLEEPY